MCIRTFILISILFSLVSCSNSDNDTFDVHPMTEDDLFEEQGRIWLDFLCCEEFQGRKIGTEGNKMAFEYLWQEIIKLGYTPECLSFETESGVIGRNIIVSIPGQADSTIIIGAHYDGPHQSKEGNQYQAANDNGSGTVAILLLLKSLREDSINTNRSIICCLWDGEEVFDGKAFRGSRFYVSTIPDSLMNCILHYENLDTIGHDHENNIFVEYSGNERIFKLVQNMSFNNRFEYHISECTIFNSDYTPFHSAGIPIINYHDHNKACEHPSHSIKDVKDAISVKRLVKIVNNVRESIVLY